MPMRSGRAASWARAARAGLLLCLLAGGGAARAAAALPRLPALALQHDAVTVSGLSSGGYMAGQFEVAYSASVAGAAVLEAGPYGCARGSVSAAMLDCSCPDDAPFSLSLLGAFGLGCRQYSPAVYRVFSDTALQGNQGAIDDPANLRRHRVWLLSGGRDRVVPRALVDAAQAFYRGRQVPEAQLHREDIAAAGHGFPSPLASAPCGTTATPYLVQCGFDAAGALLRWLYPDLPGQPGSVDAGALRPFMQTPYRQADDGLDRRGWIYLPKACETAGAGCRLHVVFHGCEQGQAVLVGRKRYGTQFVTGTGYNRWAEAGRIVVLYPQVKPNDTGSLLDPYRYDPKGCWDFWGYTERDASGDALAPRYATRDAPQMRAVKAMIDALLAAP